MKHWSKKSRVWNNWKIKLFDSYHYEKEGQNTPEWHLLCL